jgi:hypothetical protein
MTDTLHLGLPLIAADQAQKHVTHNEAIVLVDLLAQLAVLDRDLDAPPAGAAEGGRWIVGAAPTGPWAGRAGQIAMRLDGAWIFRAPGPGWIAYVIDEGTLVAWTGSAWSAASLPSALQNLTRLGIGTDADAQNPFAAKLNKALWTARTVAEGGDGSLRYTLNKEGAGDVLSLLLQSAFSGRAEIGLVGDEDLTLKVSGDGAAWTEALRVDRSTGRVAAGAGLAAPNLVRVDADQALAAAERRRARRNVLAPRFDAAAGSGLLVNPFLEISQERGAAPYADNAIAPVVDGVRAGRVGTAGLTIQQVANPHAGTGGFRRLASGLRTTIATPQGSFAPGEHVLPYLQTVEGTTWRFLGFGTADAQAVDILLVLTASVTGTYAVALRNAAADRSHVQTVALAAGAPTVCLVTVPGDTTGAWPGDTGAAASLAVGAVAASNRQAAALGAWGAGNALSHASATNWAATAGASLTVSYADIFPAGLLPFAAAGQIAGDALAVLFGMRRRPEDEERRAQRQWQRLQVVVDAAPGGHTLALPVPMRAPPVVTGGGAGFAAAINDGRTLHVSQTTRAAQTLLLDARL